MLFLDTSALAKLYVDEAFSDRVRTAVERASVVVASRISWAEIMSAFARRTREVPDDAASIEQARAAFREDWPHILVLEVTQAVVERAGDYADLFALRAYDSVQLASAFHGGDVAGEAVDFACFDARLNRAAAVLGMRVLAP